MTNLQISSSFAPLAALIPAGQELFVLYDRNVEPWMASLAIPAGAPQLGIDCGEDEKSWDTVSNILQWLIGNNAGRDAFLLVIGGGTLTDIAGFTAAVYKRGIRTASVPTTLLAQVDAAIGGKNGINFNGLKNAIGLFREPEFIFICPKFLQTLPLRHLRSGAAEMLKTFIIHNDNDAYARAVAFFSQCHSQVSDNDLVQLQALIEAAVAVKTDIVRKDPYETGLRRVLNLGHTIGHAIESWQQSRVSDNALTHGEAVAVGIIEAARISERLGVCEEGLAARLAADLPVCGLPVHAPAEPEALRAAYDTFRSAISNDKKATSGGLINFVLIKSIGEVEVRPLDIDTILGI